MEANQLIAEIARTTGVRLDRSDPILAAAVVHEALLNEALVKLDRQVTIQADRVSAASTQAVVDAKTQAEALLTDAASWLDERVKSSANAAASMVVESIRSELRSIERVRRQTLNYARIAVVAGLLTLSGVAGVAWAIFE